jgi:hypothetical protein
LFIIYKTFFDVKSPRNIFILQGITGCMPFSKSFPRNVKGSAYPIWEEIFLDEEEERDQEKGCRRENLRIMIECIEDAKLVFTKKSVEHDHHDIIKLAIALFDKRASHVIYWKENKAKEKFDKRII